MKQLLMTFLKISQSDIFEIFCKKGRSLGYDVRKGNKFIWLHKSDAPIALVAHSDRVGGDGKREFEENEYKIWAKDSNCGADDRCGCAALYYTLCSKRNCDFIITDEEEIGCLGAHEFGRIYGKELDVKFLVEVDRRGCNSWVRYRNMLDDKVENVMDMFGVVEEKGSISDVGIISDYCDIAHVNIGSGYYHEHGKNEFVSKKAWIMAVSLLEKLVKWFNKKEVSKIEIVKQVQYSLYNKGFDYIGSGAWLNHKSGEIKETKKENNDYVYGRKYDPVI